MEKLTLTCKLHKSQNLLESIERFLCPEYCMWGGHESEFISRLQISNIQYYFYQFFFLSYICNKTRVRCLGHTGAELGQAHLTAEYLHIVLPHLCNEQATHTISPRHFGIMHINRNAFKETTWIALNTALIITAILKQVTYITLSRSLWNWTAEINLKTWSTSGLVAWGIWAADQPDHRHTHPQSLFLMWGKKWAKTWLVES